MERRLNTLDVGAAAPLNFSMITPVDDAAAKVRCLIIESLPARCRDKPRIFGAGGSLDSLGLVNFLADLEYRLAEKFGRELVLASERAMSRSQSPFRDVSALTDYIVELLAE
jgi:hypothetical protein